MVPSQLKAQLEATFCSVIASHENTMLTAARNLMCAPISGGPVTKPQEPLITPSSKARKRAESVTPLDPATTPTVVSLCQSPPVPLLDTPGKGSRKRGRAYVTECGVRKSFRLATAKAVLSSKVITDKVDACASLAENDENSDGVVTGPKRKGQNARRAVLNLVSDSDGAQPVSPSPVKRKPELVRLPPPPKRQAQRSPVPVPLPPKRQAQPSPVPLSVDSAAGTQSISVDTLFASIGLLQERGLLPVQKAAAEQLLSMLPVLSTWRLCRETSSRSQLLPLLMAPFRQLKELPLDIWSVLHISATSKDKENSVDLL